VQERVVWEIRTLRAMWRGLEPTHGLVSEALPKETRETDRPNYGNAAPVLDPTGVRHRLHVHRIKAWRIGESV